mmetsp:Transcript_5724/g.8893  ORF Transcript_5724/g.8893 Transcript_5724/m.8893 type:complete len:315 (+) Transcript_5724:1402-2346(+)
MRWVFWRARLVFNNCKRIGLDQPSPLGLWRKEIAGSGLGTVALVAAVGGLGFHLREEALCDRFEQAPIDTMSEADEEFVYEFFVKMTCKSCEANVRGILANVGQIQEVNLDKELVVVKSRQMGDDITAALQQGGLEAKLIGSSVNGDVTKTFNIPENYGSVEENVSCVTEYKGFDGSSVLGVVRIIQHSNDVAFMQAHISGLNPGHDYSLVIHQYGDIRKGHEGPVYNGGKDPLDDSTLCAGYLGSATADSDGSFTLKIPVHLQVWELIGRGLVVHNNVKGSAPIVTGIIARSSIVGGNHKKVCTCDGTVIWEA